MRFQGFTVFAALLTALASPALAQTPEQAADIPYDADEIAIARQILDLGMPKDIREKIFYATTDQIVLQMSAAMPRELDDPGANEIIERHQATMISEMKQIMGAHIPRLMEAWARSYTVVFTKEELTDILDFVSTPSGQKFFTRSSAVVAEANYAAANQAFMSEAMAALPARRDALVKELTDYFADKKTVPEPVES